MPILTAQKQLQREGIGGFLGVNLRRDRLDLADQDVARVINADLHRRPGTVLLRLGRTNQFNTSLGATIRRLARHNSVRFQVAGTVLYRNQTSILTGLSSNLLTTLQPFRHLNDTSEWIFVADDSLMRKVDSSGTVRNWGIAAPSAAPTIAVGAAGSLTGTYGARYSYARVVGSLVATESSLSPAPTGVSLTSQTLNVTVVASSDAQVTNIRLYRTAAGGSSYLFDQQVANSGATLNSSQADSALGAAGETDNGVPNNMSWVTEFQGHLFMTRDATNPHYLWYSKRFREEVPSSNFLEIGHPSDPLQGAFPLAGFLGVFSRLTKYRVVGNSTSGFTWLEALSSRGTPAVFAAVVTSRGVLFPARDGIFLTNFLQEDTELSQAIEPLFWGQTVHDYAPIDWDRAAAQMAMAEYKDRYYFSYPHTDQLGNLVTVYSKDTQKWYFFDYGTDFRALYVEEDLDDLIGGGSSGIVQILEDAGQSDDNGTNISLTFQPATRAGRDTTVRKLFQYLIVDANAQTGTITVEVYIDDIERWEFSITGNRTRRLLRLPPQLMGFTWRVNITYAGQEEIAVHSVQMLWIPMQVA